MLIGFINVVPYAYPSAEDDSDVDSLQRSYIGSFADYPSAPDPMTEWPPADYFDLVDNACCPGNWMVRGIGLNNTWPVELTTTSTLPTGLTLALNGTLAGTPTETGPFPITVTATDVNGCTGTGPLYNLNISCAPPTPIITGDSTNTCPSLTVQLCAPASYTSYQWNDSAGPILGATGLCYDVTASGTYTVTVTDSYGCPGTSSGHAVTIHGCAVPEVSPTGSPNPLEIKAATGSPSGFYIFFAQVSGVLGYNLYEGAIGAYYSHAFAPGNVCNLPTTDMGGGKLRGEITPSAGNHYYLVTAFTSTMEGPSGYSSAGVEIPPSMSTCAP